MFINKPSAAPPGASKHASRLGNRTKRASRHHKKELGQSMLEAIIASGIIVTAVSSALTLVASSIRASKESEDSITAGNLAREGLEVVRGIRDANWLKAERDPNVRFDTGLYGGSDAKDYSAIAVFDPRANAWKLNYDSVTAPAGARTAMQDGARMYVANAGDSASRTVAGLFLQGATQPTGTSPSQYRRIIMTEPICDPGDQKYIIASEGADCQEKGLAGVRATSVVSWNASGGRVRTLTVQEDLMDWR